MDRQEWFALDSWGRAWNGRIGVGGSVEAWKEMESKMVIDTKKEKVFSTIVHLIDSAIESEVGLLQEFNEDTELILVQIQEILIKELGLPEDYKL